MYLVSACLAGEKCRYDGKSSEIEYIKKLVEDGKAVLICPEQLGGLSTPRIPCEIIEDEQGNRRVIGKDGKDYTKQYTEGAKKSLEIAESKEIKKAILKAKSPSCGCKSIYDGSFTGKLIEGKGFTAELLMKNGIEVYTEDEATDI
ncbi:DUF523 domain-containing protein [Clostridium oryzae]|uniref:Uncharacterized protein n=1 Tax=Clostridium oryzae TaxID=1450648 RepID=A0A1V4IKE4_9CLOT|nr:DUF523 domain-containing protein [Clostridium oryzae]OPJ60502.1 hypothetical protein CLORY_28110 [Clostridium oryzae]